MRWMAICCMTLIAGCAAAPSRSPLIPTSSAALEQAELECAGKGMAALATPAGDSTTYSCVPAAGPAPK